MTEEQLKTKIFEALGQASMCWSETPKGVFDDVQAVKIGNDLFDLLSKQPSEVGEESIIKFAERYASLSYSKDANPIDFEMITSPYIAGFKEALSLTPPDAEKEAVEFGSWILKKLDNGDIKHWDDDGKWTVWKNGEAHGKMLTTQELFTLYKQGGK